MKRTHIAVNESTAAKVVEIKEKLRAKTGVCYSNGDIVAKAINELKKETEAKEA
ncbi:MAG: hypothetical protein KBT02_13435 [Treponema sp.]|nr:hypothetical protein [Candidatus Treponema caballi]